MGRRDFFEERKLKRLIYVFCITLVISVIAFLAIFVLYNNKLKEQSNEHLLELSQLNAIVPNEGLEETSSTSDKNIAIAQNTTNMNKVEKNTTKKEKQNTVAKASIKNELTENTVNLSSSTNITNTTNRVNAENIVNNMASTNTVQEQMEQKELSFMAPVSGEITKDFAVDTLVYSNTLEEWTIHSGIDIRANKTEIVVASEKGVVESIKSDPRYGLTITITHANGFKTIYSNLLTTEFVSEGETVEKGDTIATVGESSSFEIADEAHLHFEMYKDGASVNPTIYLKDM